MTEWRTLTKAEFDAWHEAEKAERKFPIPGRNALTGEEQPLDVGPTLDLVAPTVVDKDDVRFPVDGVAAEVKDAEGVVLKALPGKVSWEPVRKVDGTIDAVASKTEPVKEQPIEGDVVAFEA